MKNITVAPSFVRTLVPLAVSQIVAFAASLGLTVGEDVEIALAQTIGWVVASLYYLAVRLLEQRWPKLGAFLGWAAAPDSYSRGRADDDEYVSSEGVAVGDFEDFGEDPNALVVEEDATPVPDDYQPKH